MLSGAKSVFKFSETSVVQIVADSAKAGNTKVKIKNKETNKITKIKDIFTAPVNPLFKPLTSKFD